MSALDRVERRKNRDDRLAAANITLHETVHRMGPRHVAGDLVEHALLSMGQTEWQPPAELVAELTARAEGDSGFLGDRMVSQHHADLEAKEVVEHDGTRRIDVSSECRMTAG